MPKRYSAKVILKKLKKLGFTKVSQKGSHIKLRGLIEGKLQTVIVPNHKEVAVGTFSSILKQANLSKQEFESVK
ncbi:MAG: type II toxin-antitoxin system HicA family toxin [Patescibacteria group bacterium]|nr:type II toxin-antitoxin system HicA family toxin [Patescibacteria group bacterium]